MTHSVSRLARLLAYFSASSSEARPAALADVFRLLFMGDCIAYRQWQRSISGATYVKALDGPIPEEGRECIAGLVESGQATLQSVDDGKGAFEALVVLAPPDLDDFSTAERQVIDEFAARGRRGDFPGDQELGRQFIGWRAAPLGARVSYETVLVYTRPLTSVEEEWVEGLAVVGR